MILPAARLWYEGKSKDLEEILREAESFRMDGYIRCAFQGSGQSFIVLSGGKITDVLEIGPTNRPIKKTARDLWGKSKIKDGLLQAFEIPVDIGRHLSRMADRKHSITEGRALGELRKLIEKTRSAGGGSMVDIHTPSGKGLMVFEGGAIVSCYYTRNEGFTLSGFPAFKKLASVIAKEGVFNAWTSRVANEPAEETPWLPVLLGGAGYASSADYLKDHLVDRYGEHHGPGTTLFREGDAGKELYLIVSGGVAVFKDKDGQRKVLAELGPGDFFGEMAIFNKAPRTATAETTEDSLLIRIDKEELQTLLFNSSDFRINVVRKLAHRLKDTVDEMVRLWEDPRALYLEKVIFQILNADRKWQEEGIPPGLLMQEISGSSGMRFSEIDSVFKKLLESGKIGFIRGKVIMKEPSSLP